MYKKAIEWAKVNSLPEQGVRITSRKDECYPEVSGYYIPTLLAVGEKKLARQYATWLVSVQRDDGRICAPGSDDGFVFDTGQVVRGWVSLVNEMPELEKPLIKACRWMIDTADSFGRLQVPTHSWDIAGRGQVSEGIHLYCLAPLQQAGELLNIPDFLQFSLRSRDFYLQNIALTDFTAPSALTHFYAYVQEALIELGCEDMARKGMQAVEPFMDPRGYIPAYHDVSWVCSTGMAQMAKIWYLLGEYEKADTVLAATSSLQNASGGFFGGYGPGASYFPDEEIAWAVKYYIDAYQQQISAHFDQTADIFSEEIADEDGRVKAIIRAAGNLNGKRILDAGCGKGRFIRSLLKKYPDASYAAMDISPEMLRHVPEGVDIAQGSLLDIPFPDGEFDIILCIEALEHVVQITEALEEMFRKLVPGGKLLVLDKNSDKLGMLELPDWEQWFGREELLGQFRQVGLSGGYFDVAPSYGEFEHGLFSCWVGCKKGRSQTSKVVKRNISSHKELSVDFYHVDKMEAASYLPVWKQLTKLGVNARLVLAPEGVNTASANWFDFEATCAFYEKQGIPYSLTPDYGCDLAVTTQYANILAPYKGLKSRMMYGATMFGQNFSLNPKACEGFDAIWVHGPYFALKLGHFFPKNGLQVIGNPKMDAYFRHYNMRQQLRDMLGVKNGEMLISYLPTWSDNSSLDTFLPAIASLGPQVKVIAKPHHCTLRFEQERMDALNRTGIPLVCEPDELVNMYIASDLVLADIKSGGFYDALSLNIPAIGLDPHPQTTASLLDPLVYDAALVCPYPEALPSFVQRQLQHDAFGEARIEVGRQLVSFSDGTAAIRCAQTMVEYLVETLHCSDDSVNDG